MKSVNLRSDVTLRRVFKHVVNEPIGLDWWAKGSESAVSDVIIQILAYPHGPPIAEISLRDIISKRASLKGIESRQRAALRAPKKNPKPTKRG